MSIEKFRYKYPANADVKPTMEQIRTKEGKSGRSLVAILAEQLVKEGRDGLREEIIKINQGDTMSELDPRTFQQIPQEDRDKMFINYGGIVSGVLICSIEEGLIERKWYYSDLRERYNLGTAGLQLSEIPSGVEKIEEFSTEQLKRIYSIAEQDKTLAGFIESEEGIQAMPAILREFLIGTRTLTVIRKEILPLYKERAKFLVA